jgi:gamma-glutamylcyclotransferase (GGCT)/AIG2-like uncharacterized protein YtfP
MRKIAVFGSLKKGFYNHSAFNLGEPLARGTIKGEMHLTYSYPHLLRPNASDPKLIREHEVEIYEIEDGLYSSIASMERGAGYQECETTLTDSEGVEHNVVVFYSRDDMKDCLNSFIEEYSKETVPHACR